LLVLTPGVARVIGAESFRAWRSLRQFGFEPSDLRQEFTAECIGRFERYDPRRSSPTTFATRACRQRTLQIIEPHLAAKRNGGKVTLSLSDPIGTDDGVRAELGDTVSDDRIAMFAGQRSRPAAELAELRADVDRVVTGLPAELADVARLLLEGEPAVEVARRLRIARCTLYRRIRRLREIFREGGLDRYCHPFEACHE
jgi:hypothetical protein